LALKKNHSHLYDDVTLFLDDAQAREFAEIWTWPHETGHMWEEISPHPSPRF
jgi:hypothetical protein